MNNGFFENLVLPNETLTIDLYKNKEISILGKGLLCINTAGQADSRVFLNMVTIDDKKSLKNPSATYFPNPCWMIPFCEKITIYFYNNTPSTQTINCSDYFFYYSI